MVMQNATYLKHVERDIEQLETELADKKALRDFLKTKEVKSQEKQAHDANAKEMGLTDKRSFSAADAAAIAADAADHTKTAEERAALLEGRNAPPEGRKKQGKGPVS